MYRLLRLATVVLVAGVLALAVVTSLRFFLAERWIATVSEPNLEKAVSLVPYHAVAWARLGALRQRRGESAAALKALHRSLELNRYNGPAWVEIALHWELEGDMQRSRQSLLEAVRVDGSYDSLWALANFCLRQGDSDGFWQAMRRALAHSRADPSVAFALCWRASDDPDQILAKAIPDEPEINRHYFVFLLLNQHHAALAGAWRRLETSLRAQDLETGLRYCENLLGRGQVEAAVRVWNRLSEAGLTPHQPLNPAQGRLLTNGRLRFDPLGRAFDWVLQPTEGVISAVETASGGNRLVIRLSGTHPETVELLSQLAPAMPGRTYRLAFRYSTSDLPPDTGLYWRLEDTASLTPLGRLPSLPATDQNWSRQSLVFRTGPRTRLVRLIFAYRRSSGTTRAEGSVSLADIELASGEPAGSGS